MSSIRIPLLVLGICATFVDSALVQQGVDSLPILTGNDTGYLAKIFASVKDEQNNSHITFKNNTSHGVGGLGGLFKVVLAHLAHLNAVVGDQQLEIDRLINHTKQLTEHVGKQASAGSSPSSGFGDVSSSLLEVLHTSSEEERNQRRSHSVREFVMQNFDEIEEAQNDEHSDIFKKLGYKGVTFTASCSAFAPGMTVDNSTITVTVPAMKCTLSFGISIGFGWVGSFDSGTRTITLWDTGAHSFSGTLPWIVQEMIRLWGWITRQVDWFATKVEEFTTKLLTWGEHAFEDVKNIIMAVVNHLQVCYQTSNGIAGFAMCFVQPAIDAVGSFLKGAIMGGGGSPNKTVSQALPFPNDLDTTVFDAKTQRTMETTPCVDCHADDPRDKSPSKCLDGEASLFEVVTVAISVCNLPIPSGGFRDIGKHLMQRGLECAKKALLWSVSGIVHTISTIAESAYSRAMFIINDITQLIRYVRAFYQNINAEVKAFVSGVHSFEDEYNNKTNSTNVEGLRGIANATKTHLSNALTICSAFKVHALELKGELMDIKPPYKLVLNKVLESYFLVSHEALSCFQACNATLVFVVNFADREQAQVTHFLSNMRAELGTIFIRVKNFVGELIQTVNTMDIEKMFRDTIDNIANKITSGRAASFLLDCAAARESYMKLYAGLSVLGMPLARVSVHERDGIKIAYYGFIGTLAAAAMQRKNPIAGFNNTGDFLRQQADVVTHNESWADLMAKEIHLSFDVPTPPLIPIIVKVRLAVGLQLGLPANFLGIAINPSASIRTAFSNVHFLTLRCRDIKISVYKALTDLLGMSRITTTLFQNNSVEFFFPLPLAVTDCKQGERERSRYLGTNFLSSGGDAEEFDDYYTENSALADNTWSTLKEWENESAYDFSYMCADTGSLCNFGNCTNREGPNSSLPSSTPECRKDPFALARYNASLLHCMCGTGQCALHGSCVTGKCGKMGICYPTCQVNQYVDNHECKDCATGTHNEFLDVISGSNTCCKAR